MSAALDTTLRKARAFTLAGRNDAAVDLYLGVLDKFPKNRRAIEGLSEATRVTDAGLAAQLNEAIKTARQLLAQGNVELAITSMKSLVEHLPHLPELHNELGGMYFGLSMGDDAELCYARAHRLSPINPDFAANYGLLLGARGKEPEAIALLSQATARHPDHLFCRRALARAHLNSGACQAAIDAFDLLLAAKPDDAEALADRATARYSLGHQQAAQADIARAIALSPHHAEFLRMYSYMTRVTEGDPLFDWLAAALAHAQDDQSRLRLHFALAKAHHDVGAPDPAFRHWAEANRLHKAVQGYDIEKDETRFAQAIALASDHAALPDPAPVSTRRPLFVLGMPRSGTSLLEQMLDCHPAIHGAGELATFSAALNQQGGLQAALDADAVTAVRAHYLSQVASRTPDTQWVLDKMPLNFQLIPQILAALPEAKILHIRRDPMATCWSNFRHFYPGGSNSSDFAYDLADLGRFWQLYDQMMTEWDRRFPGAILSIDYEDLINDPEPVLTTCLATLDLPWDPACLSFHQSDRAVMTSSAGQIKQPLYGGSNDAWRRYAAHLASLSAALEGPEDR